MKKIIATLALIGLLAVPAISLAVPQDTIPEAPFDDPGTLIDLIHNIGNWVFTGLLIIAAIFMVVAGYYFVTGGSDPAKVNTARQMLINALIGVAIGLASKGFVLVITNIIAGE